MTIRHCLVIDDDAIAAVFLRDWLAQQGWQVAHARSLAEASRLLAAAPVDVMLVDRRLPDGDGLIWLAGRIDVAGLRHPRCMLTSGDHIDTEALPPGVAYLRKPVDMDRLLAWLQQWSAAAEVAAAPTALSGAPPLLDDAGALARFGGNHDALRALRAMLLAELEDSTRWRPQLRLATPPVAAIDAVHRLRAACALTGCARLGAVSEAVESILRRGLPAPTEILDDLDAVVAATIAEISG